MRATVLDTKTNKSHQVDGINSFEWAENNWSCDCNRGDSLEESGVCAGSKRFLVTKAEFAEGEQTYSLQELNANYPKELLAAHGVA